MKEKRAELWWIYQPTDIFQYKKMDDVIEGNKREWNTLDSYTLDTKDAILTQAEKDKLISWASAVRDSIKSGTRLIVSPGPKNNIFCGLQNPYDCTEAKKNNRFFFLLLVAPGTNSKSFF